MSDSIIFDITGFYFQKTYTGDLLKMAEGKSVKFLTDMTVNQIGDAGRGKLTEAEFDGNGFLQTLTVDFTETEPPKSRQKDMRGQAPVFPDPPSGIYSYTDDITKAVSGRDISFTPIWQYYLFDKSGLLKSGGRGTPDRRIVPANKSASATPLEAGDRLVWRVVLIGGIRERFVVSRSTGDNAAKVSEASMTSVSAMSSMN